MMRLTSQVRLLSASRFAEDLGEALPHLADAEAFERRDFVDDVQFHAVFLSMDGANGQPVLTASLISARSSRP
jgi:hypothetical protein